MIIGIGTDITEVGRIEEAIKKYGKRFLNRIFTETEQEYCETFGDTKYVHYAARFCAKEAFSKAIGTGITQGFKFVEVGIKNAPSGNPSIVLEGGLLEAWGQFKIEVTLSHTDNYAVAFVTMENIHSK